MKKFLKSFLIALSLITTVITPIECVYCDHICDEYCIVDDDNNCQHECNYPINPLDKWDPWG